jgi:Tfp pilus assembly protein PilN
VAGAKSALNASTAKTGQLTAQQSELQKQTSIKDTVASAQATLASALAPQILWSHYLQDMSVALAGNYWFTGLALSSGTGATGPAAAQVVTPGADAAAIGTFTAQGKAVSHRDVSKLLASLETERGLSHPLFTSSAEDTTPITGTTTRLVTFSVQASVDDTLKPQASASAKTGGAAAGGTTAAPAAGSTPTSTTPAGH